MDVDIYKFLLGLVPIVLAITVHEVAHGWAALKFGDRTAQLEGRLTLNPIKHIDPLGTLVVPLITYLGGFMFGWAKPVPVVTRNLRNPQRDMIWVAAAGPASNFVMSIIWGWLATLAFYGELGTLSAPAFVMATMGVRINLILMVLNLLPLPPLDGSRIVMGLLPPRQALAMARIEPYGFFILIGLMMTRLLDVIMQPLMAAAYSLHNLFM